MTTLSSTLAIKVEDGVSGPSVKILSALREISRAEQAVFNEAQRTANGRNAFRGLMVGATDAEKKAYQESIRLARQASTVEQQKYDNWLYHQKLKERAEERAQEKARADHNARMRWAEEETNLRAARPSAAQRLRTWDEQHGQVTGAVVGNAVRTAVGTVIGDASEMQRLRQNMKFAGVDAKDVEEAETKAWELSRKYRNTSATENFHLINDSRMIYGSQEQATHHAESAVRLGAFLQAYDGGKHAGTVEQSMSELLAAIKSGEISGKITPEQMEKHLEALVAMKVAFGNQVTFTQYLQAQRAAGTSYLAADDQYKYSIFPAMVQEYSSGAGVMMQTAMTKILADAGNKKAAVAKQIDLGLRDEDGEWKNRELFGHNPMMWAATTLIPALEAKGVKIGATVEETDVVGAVKAISGAFPDRNAAKQLIELAIQLNKLKKDAALIERVNAGKEATDDYDRRSWSAQTGAFSKQFNNLLTALGGPLLPAATAALEKLNVALAGFAHFARDNPVAAGGVAGGLVAGGTLAGGLLLRNLPLGRMLLGGGLAMGLGGGLLESILLATVLGGSGAAGARVASGVGGAGVLARLAKWLPGARGAAAIGAVAPEAAAGARIIAGMSAAGTAAGIASTAAGRGLLARAAAFLIPGVGQALLAATVAAGGYGAFRDYQKNSNLLSALKAFGWNAVTLGMGGEAQAAEAAQAAKAKLAQTIIDAGRAIAGGARLGDAESAASSRANAEKYGGRYQDSDEGSSPGLAGVERGAKDATVIVKKAMEDVTSIVGSANLFHQGAALGDSLAAGLRSKIDAVASAARDMRDAAVRDAVRSAYSDGGMR